MFHRAGSPVLYSAGDALSACVGKAAYRTKGEALETLGRMRKRRAKFRSSRARERLHPYQCPHCEDWHLGAL